jgi:putative hydrolase of the HAD superfamily
VTTSPPRAITLDLDDTLWPVWPAIERAETALHDWLLQHCPNTAEQFPLARMRELRAHVAERNPQLSHDYCTQRRLSLQQALRESGDDHAHADTAYEVFFAARNEIELYADSLAALRRLAARMPLAALTNGNACIQRIGLGEHFQFSLGAREHGAAKPDASIFHAACARLGLPPADVLHVGDDPHMDVLGARRAGLRAVWINRRDEAWEHKEQPDLIVHTLTELADWLEARG